MNDAGLAESDLDFLYGLPLDRFTGERDRLAKEAANRGDRKLAAALKSLAKPNLPAWAVNQIARKHSGAVGELLDLRGKLEKARSADDIRKLGDSRVRLVAELRSAAEQELRAAGHATSASTLERVSRTLLAGETEEERALLVAGHLVSDLEPTGFTSFGSGATAPARPSISDRRVRERAQKLAREAKDAGRKARELARDADVARRAADTARKTADRAVLAAEKANEEAAKAALALKKSR